MRESGRPSKVVWTFKFSRAVKFSYIAGDSIREPIFDKSFLVHLCPSNIIFPEVGFKIPVIIFNKVDFPAPFGPNNPYIELDLIASEMLSTAICSLNFLETPFTCKI